VRNIFVKKCLFLSFLTKKEEFPSENFVFFCFGGEFSGLLAYWLISLVAYWLIGLVAY
jgi:hypothetical protein